MGYTLEFYGMEWMKLARILGSGDRRLFETLREEQGPKLLTGLDSDLRIEWENVLEDLVLGSLGQELSSAGPEPKDRPPKEVSDGVALAFVAIVRSHGERIGELGHSSAAGKYFRENFLAQQARAALSSPVDLLLLSSRPLFGMEHSEYPSWGGLKRSEVNTIIGTMALDDLPGMEDSDTEAWLYDLFGSLSYASKSEKDIVTLYL